jgi:hypothetical protein
VVAELRYGHVAACGGSLHEIAVEIYGADIGLVSVRKKHNLYNVGRPWKKRLINNLCLANLTLVKEIG